MAYARETNAFSLSGPSQRLKIHYRDSKQRYTWYIVFAGKQLHGRSASDSVIPAHCAEVDPEDKASRKLYNTDY